MKMKVTELKKKKRLNLQIPHSRVPRSLSISLYHFALCVEGRAEINSGRPILWLSISLSILSSEEGRAVRKARNTDFGNPGRKKRPLSSSVMRCLPPPTATVEPGLPSENELGLPPAVKYITWERFQA